MASLYTNLQDSSQDREISMAKPPKVLVFCACLSLFFRCRTSVALSYVFVEGDSSQT